MSIAAPSTPQPSLARADAGALPGDQASSRLQQWLAHLWRPIRFCSKARAPRAVACCAISIVVHAALLGTLALCRLDASRSEAPELMAEIQLPRQMPATPEAQMPGNLPEVVQPAATAVGGSAAIVERAAAINPGAWTPQLEQVMLVARPFTPYQPLDFDRELAPERRPAASKRQPLVPAEKADEDDRTVIELPPGFRSMSGMFAGRRPPLKPLLISQLGGTDETEAAVNRGLVWLKNHQQPDGRWCLHAFGSLPDCHGQCTHPGILSDTGGTALALLPFLAAGSTHLEGEYAPLVGRGLAWLIDNQKDEGGWSDGGIVKMYAHGLATIALSEAYAMTGDPRFREPIEKAVELIAQYQDEEGGWRYIEDQIGDNSVTGWQLMALRSAQAGGIAVPKRIFASAMEFLDTVQPDKNRGLFSYGENRPVSDTMTAEGLLSREYGGWSYNHPALKSGVAELLKSYMPSKEKPNMYYWYYATQTLHHVGGKAWQKWNEPMRQMLIDLQIKDGHMAGSWTPKLQYVLAGGRLYMTALGTLTLEVYYRHMPLYAKYSTSGKQGRQPPAK
jgi:hypothetical protein